MESNFILIIILVIGFCLGACYLFARVCRNCAGWASDRVEHQQGLQQRQHMNDERQARTYVYHVSKANNDTLDGVHRRPSDDTSALIHSTDTDTHAREENGHAVENGTSLQEHTQPSHGDETVHYVDTRTEQSDATDQV
jgi:hypothetical protein